MGNRLLRGPALEAAFPVADAPSEAWQRTMSNLNGFFAVIVANGETVTAAVDRVRSIPLFFAVRGPRLLVSDDAEWIRAQLGLTRFDPLTEDEFRRTGYVTGDETLFSEIKQVRAGEMVHFRLLTSSVTTCTARYFEFTPSDPVIEGVHRFEARLDSVIDASIDRLIRYAGDRQLIVPLSDGIDSLIIAAKLRQRGCSNVIAFSYGRRGNRTSEVSRANAARLGYRWSFVEYDNASWRSAWASDARARYALYASGWAVLPHFQDWLAVAHLRTHGVVDESAVFVPGHLGMLAGSQIPSRAQDPVAGYSVTELARYVLTARYNLAPLRRTDPLDKDGLMERILSSLPQAESYSPSEFAAAFERWEWQERQSKFLVNSVRVYEFFGFDWWLPLTDAQVLEFWRQIPLERRLQKRAFRSYVERTWAELVGRRDAEALGTSSTHLVNRNRRSAAGARPALRTQGLRTALRMRLRSLKRIGVLTACIRTARLLRHPLNLLGPFPLATKTMMGFHGYELNGVYCEFMLRDLRQLLGPVVR